MEFRIVSEDGEFITDINLKDIDVDRLTKFAIICLQNEGKEIKYTYPLNEKQILELLQYSIIKILQDEIDKIKTK